MLRSLLATIAAAFIFALPGGAATQPDVVLNGQGWRCTSAVDIDLVKITNPPGDAITLGAGCTGRIGRIEVDTWTADGVKVSNVANWARDVVVEGGYVKCHAIAGDTHQDAVQAMGGERIRFRGVSFDCLGNSNFFVNRGGSGAVTPTDVVCEGCFFGPRSATTVRVERSLRSGVLNSVGCRGRRVRTTFLFTPAATSPVNSGNSTLAASDPRCAR